MVTHRGIEASREQIPAVLQLESPQRPKDVQRLAGKVAALSRFISRASDRCKLFYDILRKSKKFDWTEEHEKSFKELKCYLSTPPLLAKPEQGEPLFLYLSVTEAAVSVVLVREQEGMQHPVYYISKSVLPVETRYTPFEKLVLALVTASYKLRPYFESHTIHVDDNQVPGPDRFCLKFLSRYTCGGRKGDVNITRGPGKWGLDLIHRWSFKCSGSWSGSGPQVPKEGYDGTRVEAVMCEFKATNNEADYEALILGMQMAQGLKVRNLRVYSDSLLVVNHVNNEYVARDMKMIAYLKIAMEQKLKFRSFKITQVPRDQNVEANALATLGATFQPTELSTILITHVLTTAIQKELEQSPQGDATRV
ncbi:uncharacterized protein LOC141620398 [Silene latifolia]|uniref:uncharacterized protein LOC141620398 n=1 Tax=Silene latifolia TaxID=37657 RepID=UPI003D77D1BE